MMKKKGGHPVKKKFIFIAAAVLVSLLAAQMPLAQEGDFDRPISIGAVTWETEENNPNLLDLQTANYQVEPDTAAPGKLAELLCNTKCRISIETFFKSPYRSITGMDAIYRILSDDRSLSITAYERDRSLVVINDTFYRVDKDFFPKLEEILSTIPKI